MEKEVRELADVRYWLSSTRSNILVWNFKATEDSLNRKLVSIINLEKTSYQQIYDFYSAFIDKYLPVTPTPQQFKRR